MSGIRRGKRTDKETAAATMDGTRDGRENFVLYITASRKREAEIERKGKDGGFITARDSRPRRSKVEY